MNPARFPLFPTLIMTRVRVPPPPASTSDTSEGSPSPLPEPLTGKTVYAIDAHSLIFQVFHALPEMSTPRGEPIQAVFGFARDLLYLLEEKRPDFLICAFDMSGPTFRHDFFDGYKADRDEMPSELAAQIPKIRELVEALGIPIYESPGHEADDVLATVARICDEQGAACCLVTGDKDCRQLISDYVRIYNIRKNEEFAAAELLADWGIRPEQVVEFQALVGDKIDCVPGVPLIGPKIACELLAEFGSLEAILDRATEVKGKKRSENLLQYREQALLSRRLVELDRHVPVTFDWPAARTGRSDWNRVADLFRSYGFGALTQRALALAGASRPADQAPQAWKQDYVLVDSLEKLADLVRELEQQSVISLDTETTNVCPRWAELVGLSFAFREGEAYYVPVMGPPVEQSRVLPKAEVIEALRPVLENPNIAKVGQNLKYDLVVLLGCGVEVRGVQFDTMVASYLLDAGARNHNLDALSQQYLDHKPIPIVELIGKGKNERRMDDVPLEDVAEYAAEDADVALRLWPLLDDRLRQRGLEQLNADVEVPLARVLARMEYHGIAVNRERLEELSRRFGERVHELEVEIEILAGHPLNLGSPKQLAEVLFSELGLPVTKRGKTGPSTDVGVLEELAALHRLPAKIIEYRQFAKLKNTYVDALPQLIHPRTGRVHASFNQVVAATGRLSCGDPNLQNIPIRTEEGRAIRSAFRPDPPGWLLMTADYSQIELRVLAHYSQDATLRQAFAEDEDIHALVASQVHGVSRDEVTPEMRRRAKAVNFGVIYGQSAFGLAKTLNIPKSEAAAFIEAYFAKYPGVEAYLTDTLDMCHRQGYVSTILGRRREIEGVRSARSRTLRSLTMPERAAVNAVIQGSAADLIKLAMIAVDRRLRDEGLHARLLLQIHDELVFEAPPDEMGRLTCLVKEEMAGAMQLDVPIKVDMKVGANWAECEAV